jgi:hypothetical protein
MKRFGYFVRLGGDAEIAEALARGAEGTMRPAPKSSSEAVRRVAMFQHTPEEWRAMTLDARRKYRSNRRPEGTAKALLIGYALVCMVVSAGFRALLRAVERGGSTC